MGTSPIVIGQTPRLDLKSLFQDPDFNKLSPTIQRQSLASRDPDFNRLSDSDYLELRKRAGHPVTGTPATKTIETPLADKVIDFLNPLVTGAATAGGAAAGVPFGGPIGATIGGLSLGSAANMLMNKMRSTPPDKGMISDALGVNQDDLGGIPDAMSNVVGNEIGGRLIGGALSKGISGVKAAFKEGYNPGAVVGDIYKLNPTYSQYYAQTFGQKSIPKFLEDILASGSKAKAMFKSQQAAKDQGTQVAGNLSGKAANANSVGNPQYLADRIKIQAGIGQDASYAESDAQAKVAKGIADQNPTVVYSSQIPPSFVNSNPQIGNLPAIGRTKTGSFGYAHKVQGPIELDDTLQHLHDFLADRQQNWGDLAKAPPQDQPVINAALSLINRADAHFDASTGKLTSSSPVSFEDAWDTKKTMDKLYGGDTDYLSQQYRGISSKLNDDIEKSIPSWGKDSQKALTAWRNAKATVEQRHAIFSDDGVRQLINTTNSPISTIDDIIKDPKKLQRALTAGNIKFPSGNVSSTNIQKDLKGYQVMKLMQDSWSPDPVNPGLGSFDVKKIADQLNDPNMAESYKQLFSKKDMSNIQDFFSNVSKVSQPMMRGGGGIVNNNKIWMMPGAIGISAGLLAHHITPYAVAGVSITGLKLGGAVVGRLLTNPTTARIMVAASKGEPLGVSEQYAGKVITRAIQGSAVSLMSTDGKTIDGTINDKGQFTPLSPSSDSSNSPNTPTAATQ